MKRRLVNSIHVIVLIAISLVFASTASAQRRGFDRDHHRGGEHARLLRQLDLSEAQKLELRQTMQALHAEREAWREAHEDAAPEERRAFFLAHREKIQSAIQDVLTPEQLEELSELRERRGPRGGGWSERRERGPLGGGWSELNLTDDQKDAMQELRESHRRAMREWMAANENATREERQAFMREQREAMRGALQAILTAEQLEQLEEMRSERREHRRDRRNRGDRRRDRVDEQDAPGSSELDASSTGERFSLSNHPNPFNPSTMINFELDETAAVSLVVYDAQGREVRELIERPLSAGLHSVTFDASGLPSGVYLYRLSVGGEVSMGRMT